MQPPPPVEGMPSNMMGAPWGPPPRPRAGTVLAMFAVIAFLFLAGTGVFQARGMIESPQTNPEYEDYLRTIRLMTFVGVVLIDAAAFLGILFGAYVGVSRPDLPEGVRRAFVLGPLLLAGLWLLAYFATFRGSSFP